MASVYPAQFLKVDYEYGFIKEGYYADFVVLERDTLNLKAVYKVGESVESSVVVK